MDRCAKTLAAAAAVLLVAAVPASAREGPHIRPGSCFPPRAHTLSETRHARVFRKRNPAYGIDYVWGCMKHGGRVYLLGESDPSDDAGETLAPIALRDEYVAFADTFHDHYGNYETSIVSRSLRTGKTVHRWAPKGCPVVRRLVVTGTGSIAWLAQRDLCYWRFELEVFRQDRGRRTSLLDASADDAPINARHGRLYWRHGGATRSARVR